MTHWTPEQLNPWLTALKNGDVVAAPAEGVYGYCCDPFNESALKNLNELKQRNQGKGFVILIPDVFALSKLCKPLSNEHLHACYDHWKGDSAITLVLPARSDVPALLRGEHSTVAVRLPREPYMLEYLKAWGAPLVSTSANLSGQPPIQNAADLPADIQKLTLGEPLSGSVSRIFDVASGKFLR